MKNPFLLLVLHQLLHHQVSQADSTLLSGNFAASRDSGDPESGFKDKN